MSLQGDSVIHLTCQIELREIEKFWERIEYNYPL